MFCSRFNVFIFSTILLVCLSPLLYLSHDSPHFFHAIKNSTHSFSKASHDTIVPLASSLKDVFRTGPPPALSKPRIRLVSMLFGDEDTAHYRRCLETHSEHGRRWGYETHVLRQEMRTQKYYLLNKTLYILSFLLTEMAKKPDERAEWIVWVDADAVIMNPNIPWGIFLPPSDSFSDIHIVASNDWGTFNSGVFLVRVCEWSVKILTNSAALPEVRPDVELRGDFVEQDAMQWVFRREENQESVVYAPEHWFNGGPVVESAQAGKMVNHFAGWGDQKKGMMAELFDSLERSPQESQIPLNDTFYPAEIETFWSRLRDAQDAVQKAKVFLNGSSSEGDSARKVQKACLELEGDMRMHTDEADVVEKSIAAVLTALDGVKEAEGLTADRRKGGKEGEHEGEREEEEGQG